jgi:uncharacterized integral membrane protein
MDYFYLDASGQQQGPVNANELRKHGVTKDTLVWTPSMNAWQAAGTVPQLAELFTPAVTPPYQQPPYQQPQQPYQQPQPSQPGSMPSTYLWQAIGVTILCCLFFGIPAIVNASKVERLFLSGDYAGAEKASANAKMWVIVSIITGIIGTIIYVIYAVSTESDLYY